MMKDDKWDWLPVLAGKVAAWLTIILAAPWFFLWWITYVDWIKSL